MADLLPQLKKITVDPRKLYLDPNNPRFITHEEDRVDEARFLDDDIRTKTREKMKGRGDEYDIKIIKSSILKNGWQPVDSIFVQKFGDDPARYIVLEGNRRIAAVKELLDATDTPAELKQQLDQLAVMEIVDKIDKRRPVKSRRELDKKIAYLLGVRHHGSLKKWSPFAQAATIFEKYLANSEQTDATFEWNQSTATEIALTLSMKAAEVKERIQVFRAMKQIGDTPRVKDSESGEGADQGGMKDTYYSVCKEVVSAKSSGLRKYIRQDPMTFLLDEESLQRLINLCHFDKRGRAGSPIKNPQQWRFLGKILDDLDDEKRAINLSRVENDKDTPEVVWAEREAEMQRPEWGRWLRDVTRVFQGLTLAQIEVTDESKATTTRLVTLLAQLND